MKRTKDVAFVNSIVNHPEVFPWIALPGQESVDCAVLVNDYSNIVLKAKGGCFIFVFEEPGLYEVHSQFLPEYRGKNVFEAAQEALKWMFLGTDCLEIRTRIPPTNPGYKLPPSLGFALDFERPSWPTKDGFENCLHFSLTYWGWIKSEKTLGLVGKEFHEQLLEGKARLGVNDPQHEEEEVHNIRVGAAIEMARRGQPEKGVWAYNRWARFAQYERVTLLEISPVIVDIGEAVIRVNKNNIEVLSCQQPQQ